MIMLVRKKCEIANQYSLNFELRSMDKSSMISMNMMGLIFFAICFNTKQSPRCPLFVAEAICLFETCCSVSLFRNAKRTFLFVNESAR